MGLTKIERRASARLHPLWIGGSTGYAYSVICRGELIVDRSRDPECDAARALLAKGITGTLTMLDGKTGVPRAVIDIERTARLTTEEGPWGPRFVKYRKSVVDRAQTAETDQAGSRSKAL